jgi:hypothetical protein
VTVNEDRDAVRQTILEALLFALVPGGPVELRLDADGERARVLVVGRPADGSAAVRTGCLYWPVAATGEEA